MKKINHMTRIIMIAWIIGLLCTSNSLMIMYPTAMAATTTPQLATSKKTLYKGYKNYTVKINNVSSQAVKSYTSSNKKVATVTSKGVVKPVSKGTATITVKIKDKGKTYSRKLKVTVKNPSIEITDSVTSLDLNNSFKLKAKTYGIKKPLLTWSSSNKAVISVQKRTGKVTAVKAGSAIITAKDKTSGKKTSITIKVIGSQPVLTPKPTATPIPTPKPTAMPTPNPKAVTEDYIYTTVFVADFENGSDGFTSRGGENVSVTGLNTRSGSGSLVASGRTASWQGPVRDMTSILQPGKTYQLTAWLQYVGKESNLNLNATIDKNNGAAYQSLGSISASSKTWKKLDLTFTVSMDTSNIKLYFEIPQSQSAELYLDDLKISEVSVNADKYVDLPNLSKLYKEYFTLGTAVSSSIFSENIANVLIENQFNTITFSNEMKPDALLDYETSSSSLSVYKQSPAIRTDKLKQYLQFAKDKGYKVRFHTLVWHSQTPRWFFTENYSKSPSAPLASREVMLKRMENYIQKIMKCVEQYPDVIYAWDVVNEAIEPNHNHGKGYRTTDSLWYQIIGEDYIEKAFEYARKYSYDDAGLYYNDYNTYMSARTNAIYNLASKLKAKGLIDGIGMQSHIDMGFPTLASYEAAIKKFAGLGLKINITELDMHNPRNTEEALELQADRYADLFSILVRLKKEGIANITNVTFWGTLDSDTWLTAHRKETSYPLLFDGKGNPKVAFHNLADLNAIEKRANIK